MWDRFVNSICWDQTGELLLSGGDDKRVTIWKPSSHLPKLLSFDSGHKGNIYGARFAPDGDAVIATCSQDNTVKVHKLGPAGTRCTLTLWSHSDFVNAIEMHPRNPKILWSGSSDGSVRCFDLRQKSGYGTWFHESGIASGPCGPWGMQGFSRPDGRVEEWKGGSLLSCEKNVETKSVFAWPSKEEGIFSMSLDPLREQYFVTAGEGKYIRLYDIRKPPKIAPGDVGHVKKVAPAGLKYLSQITGVRYNFDGSKCLASCTGGDIYLVAIRENSQRIRAHQRFGARSSTLLTKPKSKSKSKSKSIASYTHRLRPRKRSREQTDHDPVTRPKQSYRSSYAITSPSVNPKLNPSDQSKSMTPNGHNMTVTTGTSCASMQRALTLGEKVCGSKVEAKHYKEDPGDEKVVLGDETMSTKHDGRDSDSRRRNGKGEQHHRESSLLPQGDHPPTNTDNGQNPMHTEQHQQEPGSDLDLDLDQDAEPEPEPESGQGLVDTDNLLLGVRVKRMYEGGLLSLSKRDYRRAIKLLKGAIGLSRNTEPAVSRAGMYMQRSRAKYHLVIDRKARLSERKRRETLSSALRDCERACVLAKGTDLEDEIRFSRARLLFHFGRFKEALAEAKLLLTLPAHKTSVPREAIGDLITSIHMVFKNQPEVVGAGGILSFKFEGNESPGRQSSFAFHSLINLPFILISKCFSLAFHSLMNLPFISSVSKHGHNVTVFRNMVKCYSV